MSDAPPYYLGHKIGTLDENGDLNSAREIVFLDFELLTVVPQRRIEAVKKCRAQILERYERQDMWWQKQ